MLALLLILAGVLYRGLIPAGYMPAVGKPAQHSAWLVVCHHGEAAADDHGPGGAGQASVDQCPFGAAVGPAIPSAVFAFAVALSTTQAAPDWNAIVNGSSSPRLQPPARAPPQFS